MRTVTTIAAVLAIFCAAMAGDFRPLMATYLGGGEKIDVAKQVEAKDGVAGEVVKQSDRYNGTDTVFANAALKPGASQELVVPFAPNNVW